MTSIKDSRVPLTMYAHLTHTKNGSVEELEFQKDIDLWMEHNIMLETLKGDGAASVSVEAEFSDKSYGRGISLKVRCHLTVNQTDRDVQNAYQFAAQIVQDNLEENIPHVRAIYDRHFNEQ